jgi:anti-anti-sigma factor
LLAAGTVETTRQEGAWVLTPRGEHDISTSPSLGEELERAFTTAAKVVVDLSEVEFLDSITLRGLTHAQTLAEQHQGHEIVLVVPLHGFARRIVMLTGIDEVVPTYLTRRGALASVATATTGSGRDQPTRRQG